MAHRDKKLGRLRKDTLRSIAEDRRKNQKIIHMRSKYKGWCRSCREDFPVGADIVYDKELKEARHEKCPETKRRTDDGEEQGSTIQV